MNCPFLKGKSVKMCGAVGVTVLLTSEDLENYCLNENHKSCPVYMKLDEEGKKRISLKEYYLISERAALQSTDSGSGKITA